MDAEDETKNDMFRMKGRNRTKIQPEGVAGAGNEEENDENLGTEPDSQEFLDKLG